MRYLKAIDAIKDQIKGAHSGVTMDIKDVDPKIFDNLSIRFFGDTILITYQIKNRAHECKYYDQIVLILNHLICAAFGKGLLFRGSLALGEYVDKGNVVLGPAVFDAATWYDKLDMIGVVATPQTSSAIKSMLRNEHKNIEWTNVTVWMHAVLETHSSKTSKPIELFTFNWPVSSGFIKDEKETSEQWFYRNLRQFPVPPDTESKFQNTERFFLKCHNSEQWKEYFKTAANQKL
jgi:hypothetical protein